jgi:hypothetical protein
VLDDNGEMTEEQITDKTDQSGESEPISPRKPQQRYSSGVRSIRLFSWTMRAAALLFSLVTGKITGISISR